ncbi:MAG: YhdH/YhfP family quinone oxidoreductase [Chloroflexi bacterium]|nr:YhdH/YhfP family quinone oxidoreductase [Chloroflexota bacterium]
MADFPFKALVVSENPDGSFSRRMVEKHAHDLPAGEVLVRVLYSSLNYKDALSASGNKGVTRRYPHTPGIDAAGVVVECVDGVYRPGDEVLIKHPEFGTNTPGGFSQYARVPSDWVMKLPAGMAPRNSMAYGTAGLTAALSLQRLQEHGISPQDGEILVTGATGGVGSIAVALLAKAGYMVVAATGKPQAGQWLAELGAQAIIHRDEINDRSGRPLLRARWAGVVDTVGGNFLATALRSTRPGGTVTCCGNVASPELALTVYPFILRGVSLIGIDIANCPTAVCRRLWARLASEWRVERIEASARECSLDDLSAEIDRILNGGQIGRVVVNTSL